MKIFTEEQVIDILTSGSFPYDSDEIDEIFSEYPPIKLPSEEEIRIMSLPTKDNDSYSTEYTKGFNYGAQWVIEQIKQQDNGKRICKL